MRLLLINPNSTEATTERIAATARASASPGTQIDALTAASGIPAIETPEQSAQAEPAVLNLVAEHAPTYDALIIAAFSDPGLAEARRVTDRPVIGIAESALLRGAEIAERFAIVTLGAAFEPLLWTHAERCGVRDRLASIRFMPWPVAEVGAEPDRFLPAFRHECARVIAEDGAGAIVIGGGPLSGVAATLAGQIAVPLLDGVVCAVQRAEALAAKS